MTSISDDLAGIRAEAGALCVQIRTLHSRIARAEAGAPGRALAATRAHRHLAETATLVERVSVRLATIEREAREANL